MPTSTNSAANPIVMLLLVQVYEAGVPSNVTKAAFVGITNNLLSMELTGRNRI
jgi:hypothetical protein